MFLASAAAGGDHKNADWGKRESTFSIFCGKIKAKQCWPLICAHVAFDAQWLSTKDAVRTLPVVLAYGLSEGGGKQMWENIDMDRHLLGEFELDGEKLNGEIIYNKENGVILLKIEREVCKLSGKSYGSIHLITGKLHSGALVSLYHNKCVENHTRNFAYQTVIFQSDYMIFGRARGTYHQLICELENGLQWSGLSQVDTSDFTTVKFRGIGEHIYHWFHVKIKFSSALTNELMSFPRREVSRVVERLTMEIESEEKQEAPFFIQVRNKVISLISFAIKDNINVENQYLVDFDDCYTEEGQVRYARKTFYSSEPHYHVFHTDLYRYNFFLRQLSDAGDIQDSLDKLEPIFNLYLSLFRYQHMPPEMVFLNVVQALETFHSRFFYGNRKEKYVESVYQRFKGTPQFDRIEKLLLSETQMDENCGYIILVSRLNDLLIGELNGLFSDFYSSDSTYAQRIADTRHYYTHYGKSKEAKAFKGDDLLDAIYILRLLLEYYICRVLNIDIEQATRRQLANFRMRRSE